MSKEEASAGRRWQKEAQDKSDEEFARKTPGAVSGAREPARASAAGGRGGGSPPQRKPERHTREPGRGLWKECEDGKTSSDRKSVIELDQNETGMA